MIDNPSYSHYATHDESEYPEFWRGVRGYWAPCLGPSGTRLHDIGGLANWGTLTSMDAATDWVVDGGRYGLRFRGSNERVVLNYKNLALGDWSVSVWHKNVRTGSGDWDTMVSIGGFNGFMLNGYNNQTTRKYSIRRSGVTDQLVGSTTYDLNRWNHVVYTQKSNSGILYLNGKADSVATSVGPFNPTDQPNLWTIGSYFGGQFSLSVDGMLDDVVAWENRVLTENEVAQLYQIGRGGMLTPRRRRRAYFVQTFSPGWASGSNVVLQPSIGVS